MLDSIAFPTAKKNSGRGTTSFLLVAAFLILTSCASDREVPAHSLVERQRLVYEVNTDDPFTGVALLHHENGLLAAKFILKDGQLDGPSEIYYENGQLQARLDFMPPDEGELFLLSLSEGIEAIERGATNEQLWLTDDEELGYTIIYDSFDGPVEFYQENGQPQVKSTFKNGQRDGPFETYYENGQPQVKVTFKNGQRDGPLRDLLRERPAAGKSHLQEWATGRPWRVLLRERAVDGKGLLQGWATGRPLRDLLRERPAAGKG